MAASTLSKMIISTWGAFNGTPYSSAAKTLAAIYMMIMEKLLSTTPIGTTKLIILAGSLIFSPVKASIVEGIAAIELLVPNAMSIDCFNADKMTSGERRRVRHMIAVFTTITNNTVPQTISTNLNIAAKISVPALAS